MIRLIKKAQKGDNRAFLKLFQQYQDDIYRIAFTYVKNQNDALDVVQETAYRSFKKIVSLRNPEYFKTWLIKIAINCSIELIRKNKKVIQLKPEYEEYIGSVDEDVTLTITLQDLLERLSEDEKSVILLKFYQGYSLREIADILNLPLGTTKSILYRAINRLRKQFEEARMYE
ncbi:RNA polymerase [Terribacillus saccharophilus]|uniref:RNA polymerase n=1 Tax=Terribacillus saccharophilus TaxID=361277 RepID=A0A268HE85_9BACI|nr:MULTISPECIES: sigma-70 family RNA polymerase sigma factor [Terribacillus]PAE08150.1 RNA polymerase [Terribacillus saccharophilus]